MTIGHIKETLIYSYKEKIDYKIIKGVSNGMKGKPKETILLTPKCFKLMAMQEVYEVNIDIIKAFINECSNIAEKSIEKTFKGGELNNSKYFMLLYKNK